MLRRRHHQERGQALIMALAVIGLFGLVTTSMLRFTGTIELQQANTTRVAAQDAASEGGALFAAADAVHGGTGWPFSLGSCVAGSQTSAALGTQTVSYTTASCNPGATLALLAQACAVCALDTGQAATIAGTLTAQGPIAFNAAPQVTSPGLVTSRIRLEGGATNPGFIACAGAGPGCAGAGYSPAGRALANPIMDPLDGAQLPPVPPPSPDGPGAGPCANVDDSWDPSVPIPPGVYCSITLGRGSYTLAGGVYTILNILQVSGSADLQSDPGGPGVLLYFTCHDDGSSAGSIGYVGACVNGDAGGGVLDFSGSGEVSLNPYLPADGTNPDAVVIYVDRLENARAPYVVPTSCTASAVICVDGSGEVDLQGTVYARSGGLDVRRGRLDVVAADGSATPTGDVVVATLSVDAHAAIEVDGLVPAGGYCFVYDDTAAVTNASATLGQAHVVVQVNCPNGDGGRSSGIVNLSYGP